jgi:UDP-N-acetylmuramoyl-tripeptide--D-alanyl-D-alanine ligase
MVEFSGATFDSRQVKPGMLFVALKGENADGRRFIPDAVEKGAAGVVEGLEALHEAAREYRRSLRAKVVALTGSAGKTTTKELLRSLLSTVGKTHATEGNFNNHIGLPMTILNCPRDAEFLVLEMGTNHPGEIAALCSIAEPDAALITNIGNAHLEFFGSQEAIAREKGSLFASLRPGAVAVAGSDNRFLDVLRSMCPSSVTEADVGQDWIRDALQGVLPGEHNVANAAIAFALAEKFGVSREMAAAAFSAVSVPGSRWRKIERNAVTFIDDSYNANPEAMIAALDAFAAMPCKGKRVAVLGDMLELGPESERLHRKVFDHAMSLGIPLVIGVGEMSSKCLCHLVYKSLDRLRCKFRFDVSAGDLVLLKASNSMKLGELIEAMPR